jgi:uncharacterized protein (TIGR02453 family)
VSDFAGFPESALDFYDDLEVDNTRSYWEKHKETYATSVRAPMLALAAALGPEFGEAKVYRPYRDVRFAKDKTPYKTHQGAFVQGGTATGWYVEVSARGVRTGAGFYRPEPPALAAIRAAIDHDRIGGELEDLLAVLAAEGFEVGGERLKTSPRGYPRDHPRIELLRHTTLVVGRAHGFAPVIHTPGLLDVVRDDWRALRPLVEWVATNAAT